MTIKDNLTDEEIDQFVLQIENDLYSQDFHDVFLSAKGKIEEYPNCEKLIYPVADILDAKRMEMDIPDKDTYDDVIYGWYERCLLSEYEDIRSQSANSLFYAFFQKEDYDKASGYLDYLSLENLDRKRNLALLNSKTGYRMEAYRIYEELLLDGHQQLQITLDALRALYMEDDNHEMANKLVEVSSSLASLFEMGKYIEASAGLDVATWKKDSVKTLQIMKDMLGSVEMMFDFQKSKLYQHMEFRTVDSKQLAKYFEEIKQGLLQCFDDESFDYMQGNEDWEKLKRGYH